MRNLQWDDLDQEWIQLLRELVESDITKEVNNSCDKYS